MKKLLAGLLALMIALSLTACGGAAESAAASEPASAPAQSAPAASAPVEEPEEPEAPAEPTFDASWTNNAFEKLIPCPPFSGWTGKQVDGNTYEMETSEANADGSGAYYDQFADYRTMLGLCGFEVEGDDDYQYNAKDAAGNAFEFKCGDGWAWITIRKAGDPIEMPEPEAAFHTDWAENDFQKLLPQPPFKGWTVLRAEGNVCMMQTSENVDGEVWADYCGILLDYGFSIEKVGDYSYKGFDENGNYFEFPFMGGTASIIIERVG